MWDFREAADFAGTVEEFSRVVEYLQLVAAGAVDRTRKQAAAAATKASTAWTTGWRDDSSYGAPAAPDDASGAASGAVAVTAGYGGCCRVCGGLPVPLLVDDGYRNTTEFLRARLRISAAEARRRLCLAGSLLPRQGFTGEPLPPSTGNSVPPSPPGRSRPGPRPSSPWPWTGSGTPATPRPPPGWSTP